MKRTFILSGSPYESKIGFSRAVLIGNRILISGTAPIWPDGSCDPDPLVQTRRCLGIILDALCQTGASAEHVVRTRVYLTGRAYADAAMRAHAEVFADVCPAATIVLVAGLLDDRWKVEIEAEAVLD